VSPYAQTLEMANDELMFEEDELSAVMVYKLPDQPVTRLELLSLSNKTSDLRHYLVSRRKTLNAGLKLVEIDYLHETPSLFSATLPDYSQHEDGTYPYNIIIADPTPTLDEPSGITRFYCFHVDEAIPSLVMPLLDDDSVLVEFGRAYAETLTMPPHSFYRL
jgi:hypothetical protein